MGLHMASIYCPDCNRQAGDNWTECYFCGGKNLKEGEPSPFTSIPEESKEGELARQESLSGIDDRVKKLLDKSYTDELTQSEKDELSKALRPLSAVQKVALQMEYKNIRPEYTTKQRLISLFLTIILIAVVSIIAYFIIKFEMSKGHLADDTPYTCEELMSDIRQEYPDTAIPYYDISWEQVVSITNIKQTKLEGDNDISCRGNVILKNSPFNETEGEIYFFKDRNWWYYQITPLE